MADAKPSMKQQEPKTPAQKEAEKKTDDRGKVVPTLSGVKRVDY